MGQAKGQAMGQVMGQAMGQVMGQVMGQAHYTSAPPDAGSRHGGFRFTAVSPAARGALDAIRTRYLPPPDEGQLAALPVAFAYDRPADGIAVLTRTHATGRDYSGRLGNYFCHALVAAPDILVGLRPVELWGSPLWASAPAAELGDVPEPLPGDAVGPARVRRLLDETGERGEALLARLLDRTLRALDAGTRGTGAALLADSTDRVVDWIAAVSYALPAGLAADLTFTSYSGQPDGEHFHLVGTTRELGERCARPRLDLDTLTATDAGEPCAAARFLAAAWARDDLDAVDAVAELWDAAPDGVPALREACAILAGTRDAAPLLQRFAAARELLPATVRSVLERSEAVPDAGIAGRLADVAPEMRDRARAAVETALDEAELGSDLPSFVRTLGELRLPSVGVDPERVRDAAARHAAPPFGGVPATLAPLPEPYRTAVLAGLLAALERNPELRATALDPPLCAYLADADDVPLREAPGVALHVLRKAVWAPERSGVRLLKLYGEGLLTEAQTFAALRDLVLESERRERPSLLHWRRGSTPEPG
ncbi:hypothetical protein AB0J38_22870 [Streptomyces sp. NPDC050095]|uniref:GAP1-N2 domain-containing protein n=1 Tax=unclassified Streptomyces TaxID=2593676 RepID=UPI00343C754F